MCRQRSYYSRSVQCRSSRLYNFHVELVTKTYRSWQKNAVFRYAQGNRDQSRQPRKHNLQRGRVGLHGDDLAIEVDDLCIKHAGQADVCSRHQPPSLACPWEGTVPAASRTRSEAGSRTAKKQVLDCSWQMDSGALLGTRAHPLQNILETVKYELLASSSRAFSKSPSDVRVGRTMS